MVHISRSGFGKQGKFKLPDSNLIEDIDSDDKYYQVLFVESPTDDSGDQVIHRLCTKQKKTYEESVIQQSSKSQKQIQDLLPSGGVEFPTAIYNVLAQDFVRVANYYSTARCLLQTRKISQLIARSWWAHRIYTDYLKTDQGNPKFDGNWADFLGSMDTYLSKNKQIVTRLTKTTDPGENELEETALDILDGLIARNILLTANASAIGIDQFQIEETDLPIYNTAYLYPIKDQSPPIDSINTNDRMLVLPNSRSWNGIRLALLFAGQAFRNVYKRNAEGSYSFKENKYYQICQPIMSTSEIVAHYSIEASMESFHGQIEEIPMGLYSDLPYLKTIIPYPPIPGEEQVKIEELEQWFLAEDEDSECPFFIKNNEDQYTTGIQNATPPYPYIPISTS